MTRILLAILFISFCLKAQPNGVIMFKDRYIALCYENMADNKPDEVCICASKDVEQLVTDPQDLKNLIEAVRLERNFEPIPDKLFEKVSQYSEAHKAIMNDCFKQYWSRHGIDYYR